MYSPCCIGYTKYQACKNGVECLPYIEIRIRHPLNYIILKNVNNEANELKLTYSSIKS